LAGWTEAVHVQLDPMGRFITNKSFSPKCNDRVDLNGSPGGESAGGQGNEAKQDQDCRERSGVFGRDLEEQAGKHSRECERTSGADEALAAILDEYQRRSGNKPQAFFDSSPGAWQVQTAVVSD